MKLEFKPKLDINLTFTINEAEIRAIDALVGYDFDVFLKVFKTHLGSHYMEGHENTLRGIFSQFRLEIPSAIAKIDSLRKT